eukprot:scaffold9232_cov154-Ochromonas_danica.AAC.1
MRLEDRSCRTGRGMRGNLTDSKAAAKDSPASTSNMPSLSARVGSASQMKKYVDSGAKTLEDLTYTPTTSPLENTFLLGPIVWYHPVVVLLSLSCALPSLTTLASTTDMLG